MRQLSYLYLLRRFTKNDILTASKNQARIFNMFRHTSSLLHSFQRYGIFLVRGMIALLVILAVFGLAVDADCISAKILARQSCDDAGSNSYIPNWAGESCCGLCCLVMPESGIFSAPAHLTAQLPRKSISIQSIYLVPPVPPPNFA